MRRRAPEVPVDPEGRPAHLLVCTIADWWSGAPSDLNCDDGNGVCLLERGAHDNYSCGAFTALRRWHAARSSYAAEHPEVDLRTWPSSKPR